MKSAIVVGVTVCITLLVITIAFWLGGTDFSSNNLINPNTPTSTPLPTINPTPQLSIEPTFVPEPTPSPLSTIIITGLNIQIQYPSSGDSYFGPVSQGLSLQQPLVGNGGQQLTLSFKATESSLAGISHSINDITVTTPGFSLLSISPNVPIFMTPGTSTIITMSFQTSNIDYSGAIAIILSTT